MFVPSIECAGHRCEQKDKYNNSESSTYVEDGTIKEVTYMGIYAFGKESIDVLTLESGLSLKDQHFVDMKYYVEVWPDYEVEYFDSVLGLSIDKPWGSPETPILQSPLKNMIDSRALDSNVFSLLLPDDEREGDLMFGGYNDSFISGDLNIHPLYPAGTTTWQIEASRVSMHGKDASGGYGTLVNESLADHVAIILSETPILSFPWDIGNALRAQLNMTVSRCTPADIVPCDEISSLPTITLKLGGYDYELTGEDYVMKFQPPECVDFGLQCVPMIESTPNWGLPEGLPTDFIIVGTSFLSTVYTVFDWDDRSIKSE